MKYLTGVHNPDLTAIPEKYLPRETSTKRNVDETEESEGDERTNRRILDAYQAILFRIVPVTPLLHRSRPAGPNVRIECASSARRLKSAEGRNSPARLARRRIERARCLKPVTAKTSFLQTAHLKPRICIESHS